MTLIICDLLKFNRFMWDGSWWCVSGDGCQFPPHYVCEWVITYVIAYVSMDTRTHIYHSNKRKQLTLHQGRFVFWSQFPQILTISKQDLNQADTINAMFPSDHVIRVQLSQEPTQL